MQGPDRKGLDSGCGAFLSPQRGSIWNSEEHAGFVARGDVAMQLWMEKKSALHIFFHTEYEIVI